MLYGSTNWILFLAGIANLALGTWAAAQDTAAIAATSLAAGLVLLFAATIDRFESVKGLGIEAKTKQLDQKIVEADDALKRLREMTEITGTALIDLNSKMGRWDSAPGPRESIALAGKVRQIMRNLGSAESTISTALTPWAKTLCYDMALALTHELRLALSKLLRQLETERAALPKPISVNDPKLLELSARIQAISTFQHTRLKNLSKLTLEDYPDDFMEIFEQVPELSADEARSFKNKAARFVDGMRSLKSSKSLPDAEIWIEFLIQPREH